MEFVSVPRIRSAVAELLLWRTCGKAKNNGLGDDEAIGEGILFRPPRYRIAKTNQKPEGIMQKYTFVIACLTRADSAQTSAVLATQPRDDYNDYDDLYD
jgi:hypothetical protein